MNGFLLVDKQANCTSFDVVAKVRNLTKVKTGHLGTLDPKASGVLVLALGKATRLIEYLSDGYKSYIFDISWGKSTDSHDADGNVTYENDSVPNISDLELLILNFKGDILQYPPKYSALKINGKRAYNLARNNIDFELKARRMHVYDITILSHEKKITRFEIKVSKGFYVRSLARDIVDLLGLAGHVTYLRRIDIAYFSCDKFLDSDEIFKFKDSNIVVNNIINMNQLYFTSNNVYLSERYRRDIANGCNIRINNLPFSEDSIISLRLGKELAAICCYKSNKLIIKKMFI